MVARAQERADAAISGATFRLLSTADGLGVAEVGTVSLQRWRGAVTKTSHARECEALETIVNRHPGVASAVVVIEEDAPPPEPDMRKAVIDSIANLDDRLCCIAIVVEGRGFKAAFARSVLSGMTLLRRLKTTIKFAATVEEAASWVAQQCPGTAAKDICDGHERLKQSMA